MFHLTLTKMDLLKIHGRFYSCEILKLLLKLFHIFVEIEYAKEVLL